MSQTGTNLIFPTVVRGYRRRSSLRSSRLVNCNSYIYDGESTCTKSCPPEIPAILQCCESSLGKVNLQSSSTERSSDWRFKIRLSINSLATSPNLTAVRKSGLEPESFIDFFINCLPKVNRHKNVDKIRPALNQAGPVRLAQLKFKLRRLDNPQHVY